LATAFDDVFHVQWRRPACFKIIKSNLNIFTEPVPGALPAGYDEYGRWPKPMAKNVWPLPKNEWLLAI